MTKLMRKVSKQLEEIIVEWSKKLFNLV
jgi:hypothetical protein